MNVYNLGLDEASIGSCGFDPKNEFINDKWQNDFEKKFHFDPIGDEILIK